MMNHKDLTDCIESRGMHRRRFLASVAAFPAIAGCPDILTGSCAPFETNVDKTVCYDSKSRFANVWLGVSSPDWTVNPSNDTVETNVFTLHNESDNSLPFDPHAKELYEQTDSGWKEITLPGRNSIMTLDPGETYHWSLSRTSQSSQNATNTDYITVDLDAGEYALLIEIRGPNSLTLACVARFSLIVETS